jgi:hypothetical protein
MKFCASSWWILINKYIEMHGQQNIKIRQMRFKLQEGFQNMHFLLTVLIEDYVR